MTAASRELLWDSITRRALEERDRARHGRTTVRRDELEHEDTPFGRLRWYLHNDLTTPVTRAIYFCELEIPAGSRSGRLRHQGGIVHLVVEGRGYTVLDDERHEWEKRDVIGIPVRPEGVVFQHFNDGTGPVRMVISWPNFDSALGAEAGVALEVLDPAPEYVLTGSA
jgi:Cupin domain